MTKMNKISAGVHPAALMYADEVATGKLSRREFLVRTTALGVTATAAYGLLGMRFRVESQGGVLTVTSTPGNGTQIQATLTRPTAPV